MAFKIGGRSIKKIITGRDTKEDLKANYEKMDGAIKEFEEIAKKVGTAQDLIYESIKELNSVNGMEYIGPLNANSFDSMFTALTNSISTTSSIVSGIKSDLQAYDKASFGKKLLSTTLMATTKIGEGLLSVAEDIGDGVASLVGFVAGGVGMLGIDSALDFQESLSDAIKTELSHKAFEGYYNSDLAKASAFTENSGIAAATKVVGKTAGYLIVGGAASGAMSSLGLGATKLGIAASNVASSSTWGATVASFAGGLGAGTETGLNKGKSFNQSFGIGVATGAVQGALAFAGGILGEKVAQKAAIKEATKAANKAQKTLNTAKDAEAAAAKNLQGSKNAVTMAEADMEDGVLGAMEQHSAALRDLTLAQSQYDAAAEALTKASSGLEAAKAAVTNVENASLSSFQGYTDSLSNLGQRIGSHPIEAIKSIPGAAKQSVQSIGEIAKTGTKAFKDTVSASTAIRKGSIEAASKSMIAETSQGAFKAALSPAASAVKSVVTKAPTAFVATGAAGNEIFQDIGKKAQAVSQISTTLPQTGPITTPPNSLPDKLPTPTTVAPTTPSPTNPTTVAPTSPIPTNPSGSGNTGGGGTGGGGTGSGNTGGGGTGSGNTGGGGTGSGNTGGNIEYIPTVPETRSPQTEIPTTTTPSTTTPQTVAPTTPAPSTTAPQTVAPTPSTTAPQTTPAPSAQPGGSNGGGNSNAGTDISAGAQSGGGYSGGGTGGGGYYSYYEPTDTSTHSGAEFDGSNLNVDDELENASNLEGLDDELLSTTSIDDIIKGSKYQKIPTTSKPVQVQKKSGSSSVVPIAAGLTAAAAAGIGAKAYMDYKKNNSTGEDEEYEDDYDENFENNYDGLETEEWQGNDDSMAIDESYDAKPNDQLTEYSENFTDDIPNSDYQQVNNYEPVNDSYTARETLEEF